MIFGFGTKRTVQKTADHLDESCKWLMPAMAQSNFVDFIAKTREQGAEESYVDEAKKEYGFFLGDRLFSFHAQFDFSGDSTRVLSVEAHEDFFGLVVTGLVNSIGATSTLLKVSVNDRVSSKGRLSAELKDELLRRPTFYS